MKKYLLKDNFLTTCFGNNVYKLKNKLINQNLLKKLKRPFFIYFKTPKKNKLLIKNGFKLIDQLITFKGKTKKTLITNKVSFRLAKKYDLKKIQLISKKNMKLDRFYFDKEIDDKIAKKIKIKWLDNYFKKKRGTHLFICLKKNIIIGFCLIIYEMRKKQVIIDLISIDKKFQSKGVGQQMFSYIKQYFQNENLIFVVGSYKKNIKAINFYSKIGLKKLKIENIYHYQKK